MGDVAEQRAVVIEDDTDVRELLVDVLSSAGFAVVAVDNGDDGVEAVVAHRPDITTLDIKLPGIDGFETARRIRERSDTHLLLITALTDEADAILGFGVGADDVVTKPFRARELRARVIAAQRRRVRTRHMVPEPNLLPQARRSDPAHLIDGPGPGDEPISMRPLVGNAGLVVNRALHSVTIEGSPVLLTRTEFELLATLLEVAPETRSKAALAGAMRPAHLEGAPVSGADERAIETHMTNLRRKLGDSAVAPRFIETLRTRGYRAVAAV